VIGESTAILEEMDAICLLSHKTKRKEEEKERQVDFIYLHAFEYEETYNRLESIREQDVEMRKASRLCTCTH